MASSIVRDRELDELEGERPTKRIRVEEEENKDTGSQQQETQEQAHEHVLPPSHRLLGIPLPVAEPGAAMNFMETDVGISEYIGHDVPKIEGIIKQRFTDFLVYEVDLDSNVIHLKSLEKPASSKIPQPEEAEPATEDVVMAEPSESAAPEASTSNAESMTNAVDAKDIQSSRDDSQWAERHDTILRKFLSEEVISKIKTMYLEGPEPPRVSDNGWASRTAKTEGSGEATNPEPENEEVKETEEKVRGKRDRGRGGRGGGRGGRGGKGGGREDPRKVLSDPIVSKETRTGLHKAVRELFGGKLDTETEDAGAPASDEGSRIIIKWGRRGGSGGGRGGRGGGRGGGERAPRGTYPPYIHFTLQKTNRDTQDALGHLARTLRVSVKDLSVAGTKDKRGVTVQRVSLKRGGKTVEDVWRSANCTNGKSPQQALTQRGDRGIRIADFNYRKASLELGMLKGNAFVITLRSVQVDSIETINKALNVVKTKGFINYYGMQRFGTASVPTHSIGLALLQSDWHKAVGLILQKRHGEHPDVGRARDAWLVNGDLDKALGLMPRRVVAERCLLESYKKQKGDTRNAMGALSTIPRNLRLMYIHAYQSYVWNAIVSERIRMYGANKPVVGDLVFETPGKADDNGEAEAPADVPGSFFRPQVYLEKLISKTEEGSGRRSRKPYVPPRIKTLTEEDLDKYTIFDVIMPLPGTDVAYPGGPLGEKYKEYLRLDGLDPDNFERKQKDYTLNGSYRAILHLPKELSWSVLRYTDPDVALAQADEDKLLGFDPPLIDENGKFMALQINIQLGTAAYATMALREITKTETSSHFQTNLTASSEDQKYRGAGTIAGDGEDEEVIGEATAE